MNIFETPWTFSEKDGHHYILLGDEIIGDTPYPQIANLICYLPELIKVAHALRTALGMEITEEERSGLISECDAFFEEALHIRTSAPEQEPE